MELSSRETLNSQKRNIDNHCVTLISIRPIFLDVWTVHTTLQYSIQGHTRAKYASVLAFPVQPYITRRIWFKD